MREARPLGSSSDQADSLPYVRCPIWLTAARHLFVHWNVVIVAPPLTITREEFDEGVGILDELLVIADEYAV